MIRRPPRSTRTDTLVPYTTLFRSNVDEDLAKRVAAGLAIDLPPKEKPARAPIDLKPSDALSIQKNADDMMEGRKVAIPFAEGSDKAVDRKSTRLNSSH